MQRVHRLNTLSSYHSIRGAKKHAVAYLVETLESWFVGNSTFWVVVQVLKTKSGEGEGLQAVLLHDACP